MYPLYDNFYNIATFARTVPGFKAYLSKKGIGCSEPDLRIASIALRNKLILVTGNTRHFKVIPKLEVENWIK
jgi:predicted nucleic acid-binding protein